MRWWAPLLLALLPLVGCEEFLDEDLEDEVVGLISPAEELRLTNPNVAFFWRAVDVDDDLQYRLMIATPSFGQIQQLVLDTVIKRTQFETRLFPGKFQWRVQALNGSSNTAFSRRTLYVDSTTNLSSFPLVLREPDNDFQTSTLRPTFRWELIPEAQQYSFVIYKGDFLVGSPFTSEVLTTEDAVQLSIDLEEGQYNWGVRGENLNTNTDYSQRSLWVDTTAPSVPVLDNPPAASLEPDSVPVNFTWTQASDAGTPLSYELSIFRDSLANQLLNTIPITQTSHSEPLGAGVYFWRVRTMDGAGNNSANTSLRRLTVEAP